VNACSISATLARYCFSRQQLSALQITAGSGPWHMCMLPMQVIYSMSREVLTCIGDLLIKSFGQDLKRDAGWWRIDGSVNAKARARHINAFNARNGFAVCPHVKHTRLHTLVTTYQ
jgi:hypothetical protein